MDGLPGAAAAVGPWAGLFGVLVAGLYAILQGKLVPGSTVDRLTEQWEARLEESYRREQDWKTAAELTDRRADVVAAQLGELMTVARTSEALLRALPPAGRGGAHAYGDRPD